MIEKITAILSSVRFWIITTGTLSAYLAQVAANGFSASDLFNTISIWLGIIAGLGSLDSVAKKISGGE